MAKIWIEPYNPIHHRFPMWHDLGDLPVEESHRRAPLLVPHRVMLVRVCGFTFEFHSVDEIRLCLAYYSRKLHPSRRSTAAAHAVRKKRVAWRWEVERWHERLPLYLREEPKRVKVSETLQEALREAKVAEFPQRLPAEKPSRTRKRVSG